MGTPTNPLMKHETGIPTTTPNRWNRYIPNLCWVKQSHARCVDEGEITRDLHCRSRVCPPRHVQTCSTWTSLYRDPPLPRASLNLFIMKNVRLTNLRLASYWNAFLFFFRQYSTPAATNWKRNGRWKNALLKTSHLLLYCVFTHRCVIQFCTTFWLENPLYCTLRYSLRVTFANSIKYCVRKGCCEVRSWR